MMLQMYLKLGDKFEAFERNFIGLGREMAELRKEYAKLREEMARKEGQFVGQIAMLNNEVAKLKEENRVLASRFNAENIPRQQQTNGDAQSNHPHQKRRRIEFRPFGEEIGVSGVEQRAENETAPNLLLQPLDLEEANVDENLDHFESAFEAIAVKHESENAENGGICAGSSQEDDEEEREIQRQIAMHKNQQNYLNQTETLNGPNAVAGTSAAGFGGAMGEEDGLDDEEEEEEKIMASDMRERLIVDQINVGEARFLQQSNMENNFNEKISALSTIKNLLTKNEYSLIINRLEQLSTDKSIKKEKKDYKIEQRYDILEVTFEGQKYRELVKKGTQLRFVAKEDLFSIIEQMHLECGHGGPRKMHAKMFEIYANVTLQQIAAYVELCERCQFKRNCRKVVVIKSSISNQMHF